MTYASDEFWTNYAAFVEESLLRHMDCIWKLLPLGEANRDYILDLGSGKSREAARLFKRVVCTDKEPSPKVLELDYRDPEALNSRLSLMTPEGVVSLFSVELTASPSVNAQFWQDVFWACESIEWALSAGFYYADRRDANPVQEAGGLTSWQSTGPILGNPFFTETRLQVLAPSKMFGPNVVEVWRLFRRRT